MPTYTNVFGGNAVKPADVSYSALAMTANATLTWPGFGQSPSTSSIMDISSDAAYNLTMPSALQVSPGETVSFNNTGSFTITIKDNAGGTIVSIAAGTVWDVYVKTNATAAGTWGTLQRGAGTSAANAADLDGAGLEASAGLLRVKAQVTTLSISTVITESHRAKIVEWTGGTGTFTITAAASLGDGWYCFFKNNGSGPCTVAPTETVDGEVSVILSPGQGCLLSTDGVDFTSIAMNDPAEAVLGYASISVAGTGNYTLSASEYANKAIKFTGVLTGNRVIIVPTSLREYIVNNATTGAFTLTVKTVAGTGVAVTQTKSAYLYCDGTGVVAAETDEGAGITIPVAIADGGTGAITAPAALTNLGGTTIGTTIFTAADAAAVRAAISCAALIANTFSDTQTITKDDAVTAAVTDLFIITHSTSGTAAVGFGGGLVYKLEDAAGSIETVASVDAVLTDATNGSEDVKLSFKTMIAGAAKTEVGYIGAGWVVGAPTGGDKGLGSINPVTLWVNGTQFGPAFANIFTATQSMSAKSFNQAKGASIASAATCDIWAPADGNLKHVTGTTGITSFGTSPQAGAEMTLIFDGAVLLTDGANLNVPGGNYTTAAGDVVDVVADTTTAFTLKITKADGTALVASSGGMTLLGTLTTTSGTTQSLTSLVLTDYKYLYLSFNGVSSTSTAFMTINGSEVAYNATAAQLIKGYAIVDLLNSTAIGFGYFSDVNLNGYLVYATGLTTASTTFTLGISAGTFDAGTVPVYGVK